MMTQDVLNALSQQAGLVIKSIQEHLRIKSDSGAEDILSKYIYFLGKCNDGLLVNSDLEAISGLSRMYLETSSDWSVLFLKETERMEKIIKSI